MSTWREPAIRENHGLVGSLLRRRLAPPSRTQPAPARTARLGPDQP